MRAGRINHKKKELKFLGALLLVLLVFYLLILTLRDWGFGLSYQESESMTPGWYMTYPIFSLNNLNHGDIVLFRPNPNIENLMLSRGWILPDSPMMKYLRGLPGDFVCIQNNQLWINQVLIGPVAQKDSLGRDLPHWKFCQVLKPGQYLMISTRSTHSFDGRYFGWINQDQMIAKAIKI